MVPIVHLKSNLNSDKKKNGLIIKNKKILANVLRQTKNYEILNTSQEIRCY